MSWVRASVRVYQAHAARCPAGLQSLVRLLLLFRGDNGLAGVTALPDSGSRDELSPATSALLLHGLLERENSRLLRQKMGIVEIAMVHIRTSLVVGCGIGFGVQDPRWV